MALKATKISNAAADNTRLIRGKYITSADGDGDYIAFEIPRFAFISLVAIDIKTVYTAASTGSVTIGIKEPGIAINATQLGANTDTLPLVAGIKQLVKSAYLTNGGVVTVGITKGTSAADVVCRAFIVYAVVK